jgi:hypothetical protein
MNTFPLHTRRDFLAGISSGFAGVALSQMLRLPTADGLRDFTIYAQKNGLASLNRVLINSNGFLFVN